jgi:hypothetical protein
MEGGSTTGAGLAVAFAVGHIRFLYRTRPLPAAIQNPVSERVLTVLVQAQPLVREVPLEWN